MRAVPTSKAPLPDPRARWFTLFGALPGLGAAMMPVGACPACWPLYGGWLGSLGLAFLLDATYLLPLTALFLSLAVASFAYRAATRRGYGPFRLGLVGVGLILLGKFLAATSTLVYAGLTLLVAASVWNAWPGKTSSSPSCPQCVTGETEER